MSFMNIPYELQEQRLPPPCQFQLIWKVQANNAYQVAKPAGFSIPGIFTTWEGKGVITLGSEQHELDAGTYIIVPSDVPAAYRCLNGNWKFYFHEFDSLDMALALDLPVGIPVSTAKMAEAARMNERLINNLIMKPTGYAYDSHLALQELLLLLARERQADRSDRHPELDDILYRMHQTIGQAFSIEDWVRLSGLSRNAFFTRFRSRTGMSPNRYMQELKLAAAKTSLETTHASVKEIAAALHFYDEFHFSKLFKKRYGLSPRAYRQAP
ncbi:AraC family transcriptional regulator [Paenibacillus glycanilyticus]|uniref:helix-turn-helix domain-containing protein n=1 Tax=Paenibacillus glycanilyticus TaxID=126569 RepID=UPI00203DA237|nr:AraC family transcriptional regulator [Paenibacillus glycanilyticus]MCM3629720.1 AraC family transcriptional regulator [Paenibacillus glycanilyticus]